MSPNQQQTMILDKHLTQVQTLSFKPLYVSNAPTLWSQAIVCRRNAIEVYEYEQSHFRLTSTFKDFVSFYGQITSCRSEVHNNFLSITTSYGVYDYSVSKQQAAYRFTELRFTNWMVEHGQNNKVIYNDDNVWIT